MTPSSALYPGYVYLIGSARYGWYKIGKSKRAVIRIADIGILLPFKIEVFAIWGTSNETFLESELHQGYKDHGINGEWFAFDKNFLGEVIKRTSNYPSTLIFDKRNTGKAFLPSNIEHDRERGAQRAFKLLASAAHYAAVKEWIHENNLELNKTNKKLAEQAIRKEHWRFQDKLLALQTENVLKS